MYTTNFNDYYYRFFTSKKDISISEEELYPPINLYPEYASFIQTEDFKQNTSLAVSWDKQSLNLSNSSLKAYTFDMNLNYQ